MANKRVIRNKAQVVEEQELCYDLKLQGFTVRSIAKAVTGRTGRPMSSSTVQKRIDDELLLAKGRVEVSADRVRLIEIEKLDRLEATLNLYLMEHRDETTKVTQQLIRVAERRARLQGLDAPTQFVGDSTIHFTLGGFDVGNV